jgi:hypothetical protein
MTLGHGVTGSLKDEGSTFLQNVGSEYPVMQRQIPEECNSQIVNGLKKLP